MEQETVRSAIVQDEFGVPRRAEIIERRPLHAAKWLKLTAVHYKDQNGKERIWETLERTTHGQDREVDAVEIVPILKRRSGPPSLVAIRQFRPSTGKYVIELPAGLVDARESVEVSALRELREETGYVGRVVDSSLPFYLGHAISSTTCKALAVEIDGDLPENQNPAQHLEEGEFIEVLALPFDSLLAQIRGYADRGDGIDGKLWLIGWSLNSLPQLLRAPLPELAPTPASKSDSAAGQQ